MDEYEDQGEAHGAGDGARGGDAPGEAGEELEEGEEVGEGGVGEVVGVFGFWEARVRGRWEGWEEEGLTASNDYDLHSGVIEISNPMTVNRICSSNSKCAVLSP